ncbi:MAG: ribosomal protein L7/L12 [Bacteriovoracaceae bacterium]|nr:ribosomal protein L7/L12 [Bacteroidota bacterium]
MTEIPAEAVAVLELGNKIEAIKIVRASTGGGLKETKDIVEQYLKEHPELEQRYSSIQSENNRKSLLRFISLLLLALAVYYLLSIVGP